MNKLPTLAALALTLAVAPAAFAQQGGASQPMNGTPMQGTMQGMDMQTMMNQCTQMRQQMRPGAPITADMTRMMQDCDRMDQQMGSMPSGSSTSTAGTGQRTRTR